MQIDLNTPGSLTINNVRKLIASRDDLRHRQIHVIKAGIAYLSDDVRLDNTDNLAFRLETLIADNGYVGVEAASDDAWVAQVHNTLGRNWPNPQSVHVD